MTLLDAPAFNAKREKLTRNLLISAGVLVLAIVFFALAGIISGHGWFFSNLYAEHRVNIFLNAIEQKDYAKAYGIYENDDDWQQHPDKYRSYPLNRFTEDWTTYSPVKGPILSHRVDKSIVDGSGTFGTGVIVGVTINGSKRAFIWWQRSDGTITYPTPHIFIYK